MGKFFVNRPIVAMVIAIFMVIVGVVSLNTLPIEQYPDITPPVVEVRATYTGADSISVEQSVATPLEQEINGVENMIYMKSTNANDGTMLIQVSFEVGTDPDMNTVFTQNRVTAATAKLPEEVKRLGVKTEKSQPNILMLVTDHINMTGTNPLIGPNLEDFGPRFPDMSSVYDTDLISLGRNKALDLRIPLRQGTYVGLKGPSLETPAETRFLKMIGADAVGMSTVSEAITAVHCSLKLMAIVVITNMNLPDCMQETSIEDVILTAQQSGTQLSLLWEKIIEDL